MRKNYIAGLDLGTTKVCAVIAEESEEGLKILGFGVAPSEGLKRGLVANIAKTAEAINQAMDVAMNRAGDRKEIVIKEVNVGVAGEHITSLRHRNYVTISNPDKEVTEKDLHRLKEDVKTIRIPTDSQILHIIPEEFFIDQQGGIDSPIGMTGTKLEAVNHVVMASIPAMVNIKKSVERAGYTVKNYILQPLASSLSVLEENEQDLGTVLIDIGGGTTDVAIFRDKSIKHTRVIGVAGNQVTNDIRESLGIVTEEAERLKVEYGYATEESIIKDEDIYIKRVGVGGNIKVPISLLTQVISVRMRELFSLIDKELKNSGYKNKIKADVVLTGGGSLLQGSTELAKEVFGLPARIGVPIVNNAELSKEFERPEYATAYGLVKSMPGKLSDETSEIGREKSAKGKSSIKNIMRYLKEFLDEL